MIEIKTLAEAGLPYRTRIASMSVWKLAAIKKDGNTALDFPYMEAPGSTLVLRKQEEPEFRERSKLVVMREAAVLMAHRELFRFCFVSSYMIPMRPRGEITARFVHELLRLYAREPWSYVGLVDQIRQLGGDEREIYDNKFVRYVLPVYDLDERHRDMLLGAPEFERTRAIIRLMDKCERRPWRYRELRGYLQKTFWREMS